MKVYNTGDSQEKPSIIALIYGEGGVGKTTFASTAPKPIIADCENGAKYFGLRGIKTDVAQINSWGDMKEFLELAKSEEYETVIIDPIGELMEKLMRFMVAQGDSKLVQKEGSPTMAGWGWLKKTLGNYIKVLRDTGKNVILIAHVEEKDDEGRLVKRPKIATKISDDLIAMVDIVGYFTVVQREDGEKRVIIVDPSNDKYVAKDRTGQLGKFIPPNFAEIVEACQGTKQFSWSKAGSTIVYPEDKDKALDQIAKDMVQKDIDESHPPISNVSDEEIPEMKGTPGAKSDKVAALKKKAAKK